jgi:carboxypeptidase C (cathepsin A)
MFLGTGYSQARPGAAIVKDEYQVGIEMHQFLSSFITVFSHLQGVPTYLSGESYAGYFVPWMAEEILRRQEEPSNKMAHINLQGVTIGNGWIDEIMQTASIPEYAFIHGLIPVEAKNYLNNKWTACLDEVQFEKPNKNKPVTQTSFGNCDIEGETLAAAGNPNTFDTSTFFTYDPMWVTGGSIDNFMNDPHVQKALHVRGDGGALPGINFVPAHLNAEFDAHGNFLGPKKWEGCVDAFNDQMKKDKPDSVVPALEYISSKIKTMLYNGEHDLTCNFLGAENVLNSRTWFNGRQWSEAKRSLLRSPAIGQAMDTVDVSAEYFQLDKLSFAIVRNSGHLVPMNQPVVALDLINRFINDLPFSDANSSLPSAKYYINLPTSANNKYSYYNASTPAVYASAIPSSGVAVGFLMGTVFSAFIAAAFVTRGKIFTAGGAKNSYIEISGAAVEARAETEGSALLRREYTAC